VTLIKKGEKKMDDCTCDSLEMPKYKCNKEVHALCIAGISLPQNKDFDAELAFEESSYAPILMSKEWLDKHNPAVGGYYVVYKDGYRSYSPAKAFEEGYTRI
jgi:hypothetical protein